MNSKLLHSIIFFLVLLPMIAWTQITVSGVVLDDITNTPIIGVTIQEASTDHGTVTDIDGRFTITLESPDPILIFRYTGYTPVEIKPEGRNGACERRPSEKKTPEGRKTKHGHWLCEIMPDGWKGARDNLRPEDTPDGKKLSAGEEHVEKKESSAFLAWLANGAPDG